MDHDRFGAIERAARRFGYSVELEVVPGETIRYIDVMSPTRELPVAQVMSSLERASDEVAVLRNLRLVGAQSHRITLEDLGI